jgi:hypothetical protein
VQFISEAVTCSHCPLLPYPHGGTNKLGSYVFNSFLAAELPPSIRNSNKPQLIRTLRTQTSTILAKKSVPWLRRLVAGLSRLPRVHTRVNSVGFVVDKVALGQVFLRVLQFSPVNIILPWAPHFRKLKKKIVVSLLHSHPGRTIGP